MAIERSHPNQSSSAAQPVAERFLYLWSRRALIASVTLAVAILGYVAMWFVPEEFECSAAIYVNRLHIFDISPLNPTTVKGLAKNPELLREVFDDFTMKYGRKPGEFEKFIRQFDVKSEILQDTTVRKEVSPVLELTVRYRGREQTRFLLESWIVHLVRKFGNLSCDEAKQRVEVMEKQHAALEKKLRSLEAEQSLLSSQIVRERKLLAEALDTLAPAELPELRENLLQASARNATQVYINQPISKPEGLLGRYYRLQVDLERTRLGSESQTSSPAELAAEERALSATISRLQSEIREHERSLAQLQERLTAVTRGIQETIEERARLRDPLDRFRAVAASYRAWDGQGLPTAGDLRAVSMPVMPELRVWPKRTLVGAVAGIAAFMLSVAGLLLGHSLRRWTAYQVEK